MNNQIVQFKNVSFRYDTDAPYALNNVSFEVFEGEWLAIVGHNGSGKSTIAKLMNGLLFPEKGDIYIHHLKLSEELVWDIRDLIGMVFQNPDNQFVGTTVQDDVAFGLENHGIPRKEMIERVHEALRQVKMSNFLDQEPHHLSGGQKQRVAIASVLALRPRIIILDEATSMLDPRGRSEVLDVVRELKKKEKLTIISITHDLEEAARADRIIVMNRGEVYREGLPEDIFKMDEELIRLGLDIPFTTKLVKGLRDNGYDIPKDILNEDKLVDYIWKLKQNI
ncbi:energy-coupling factor ABC transporter ATP-binding protein [Caldibacillus thermolactis]|uniref:Energy-coupling factor ABC transporter ATP-binding protein n=1 Tax=Pallidibacillus thermolactis TaxID=251051 RepID=A0ABT2WHB1_9BACI|nr:energy-coupling factor ABC transporter ATP-binding protein [Pallidibacillus thermolactis]MCU9594059.1 energy-coupling factor ABC transporter ATP-binding protein [Pallidibacillus thermolactis]MED1673209.1 energy-coupling factor ABC transporter ATP-binding protein [Pallidibacillus thermolactis subsp. kokeshiiformis]